LVVCPMQGFVSIFSLISDIAWGFTSDCWVLLAQSLPLFCWVKFFVFFSQGRPEVENEKQCLRSWRNIMYAVFLPRELTTMGTTSMCHTSGTCWGSMAECCCHGNML
jgi:hypothetical protein